MCSVNDLEIYLFVTCPTCAVILCALLEIYVYVVDLKDFLYGRMYYEFSISVY